MAGSKAAERPGLNGYAKLEMEFKQDFEPPTVGGMIVGFSNIDPDRKVNGEDGSTLTITIDGGTISDRG